MFLTGFISDASQCKHFLWFRFEDHYVYLMNLYWKEFAPLFQSARLYAKKIILFMLSIRAVISYYLILFRPIAALQVAAIKNLFHLYSSPVALGQIYFVLVLISTNHNARYPYPEMVSRTVLHCDMWGQKFLTPEVWKCYYFN